MIYERFSIVLMLLILAIVSVLTSTVIFTIVQSNSNSVLVIKKILDRLDNINNVTQQDLAYQHTVQKLMLQMQFYITNHTTIDR